MLNKFWETLDRIFLKPGRDRERRIAALRKIPTSSTNQLKGHRIARQIKFISVSDHANQESAELDFLQQVVDAGGSGAINFSIRRHRGGFISVQGDAVAIS